MADKKRPSVRIRFKYNRETGEIEEFIIDDNARSASEAYHDQVAAAIAAYLGRNPEIDDAGPIHLPAVEPQLPETPAETGQTDQTDQADQETETD